MGAFRILYDVGKKHMENLIAHLEREGPVPRVHGNTGGRPHNTLPYSDVKNVVVFIDNFATEFGIPHPAPLHGRTDAPPVFLPAAETYKSVHAKYVESCIHAERRAAGISLFCSIWKQCLPHIKFMSPRSDVCDACEKNRRRVTEAVTEEEKLAASAALSKHILLAQHEREFYKQKTVDAKAEYGTFKDKTLFHHAPHVPTTCGLSITPLILPRTCVCPILPGRLDHCTLRHLSKFSFSVLIQKLFRNK